MKKFLIVFVHIKTTIIKKGLNIIVDGDEFSYLEDEMVACKMRYLDATNKNRKIRMIESCTSKELEVSKL